MQQHCRRGEKKRNYISHGRLSPFAFLGISCSLSEYQAAYLDLLEPEFAVDESTPLEVVGVIDGNAELRCQVEHIGTKSVSLAYNNALRNFSKQQRDLHSNDAAGGCILPTLSETTPCGHFAKHPCLLML